MNEAIAFDTLRYVKYLAGNGFTEQQAEAMAEAQVRFLNTNLATRTDLAQVEAALKTDLAQVEADLKADIARVEADLKAEITRVQADLKADIVRVEGTLKAGLANMATKADLAQTRYELIKWMAGMMGGAVVATSALVVALIKFL